MKMVFGFKDDWDLVQNGIEPLGDCAIHEELHTKKRRMEITKLCSLFTSV